MLVRYDKIRYVLTVPHVKISETLQKLTIQTNQSMQTQSITQVDSRTANDEITNLEKTKADTTNITTRPSFTNVQ